MIVLILKIQKKSAKSLGKTPPKKDDLWAGIDTECTRFVAKSAFCLVKFLPKLRLHADKCSKKCLGKTKISKKT